MEAYVLVHTDFYFREHILGVFTSLWEAENCLIHDRENCGEHRTPISYHIHKMTWNTYKPYTNTSQGWRNGVR